MNHTRWNVRNSSKRNRITGWLVILGLICVTAGCFLWIAQKNAGNQKDAVVETVSEKSVELTDQPTPPDAAVADKKSESEKPAQTVSTEAAPAKNVELTRSQKHPFQLTNTTKTFEELRRRDSNAILLKNAIIDVVAAKRWGRSLEIPEELRADENAQYQIVKLNTAPTTAVKEMLEGAGAEICRYVPNKAYAVRVTGDLETIKNLPVVEYVEPYHPYFKVEERILAAMDGNAGSPEYGDFIVSSFDGTDLLSHLDSLGVRVIETINAGGSTYYTVRSSISEMTTLARMDDVSWIEPRPNLQAMNDLADRKLRGAAIKKMHPSLDGRGVTVGVTDSGIDFTNPGFAITQGLPTSTNLNTRIAKYLVGPYSSEETSDYLPGDNIGHGTHVAGIILGNGALSDTVRKSPGSGVGPYRTNEFAGVAPGAHLVMVEDMYSYTYQEQAELHYQNGARIINNSWGDTNGYEYSVNSEIWDGLVRDAVDGGDNQELIVFFSAGNDGNGDYDGTDGTPNTIRSPGNAKNVITVGALEQRRQANNLTNAYDETDTDWQVAHFSSRGPVASEVDIRIKPDIVAPGSYVLSIQSKDMENPDIIEDPGLPHRDYEAGNLESGTNFAFFSGTSMASPAAAGAAALIYQYYTNYYGAAPSPAMMKALMVAGAEFPNSLLYRHRWGNNNAAPDIVDQGWGMPNLVRALHGFRVFDGTTPVVHDQRNPFSDSGEEHNYEFSVNAGEGGVRIVLAYSDAPGFAGDGRPIVNDIDLRLRKNGSDRGYLGNMFSDDGINSDYWDDPSYAYADGYNNVEVINVPDLEPGDYTIDIYAETIGQGPQDYALVIMKGAGFQGRTVGFEPDMMLDDEGKPVIAYAGYDHAGSQQIFVRKWMGPIGDGTEMGTWERMEDQWYQVDYSAEKTGISKSLEDDRSPSIAISSNHIYVAWVHEEDGTNQTGSIHFKKYDGTQWGELGLNSAQGTGLSGNHPYYADLPDVEVGTDGHPVVAWSRYLSSTEGERVFVARWNGSAWVGYGNSLSAGIVPPGSYNLVYELDMVIDRNNRPVVAWRSLNAIIMRRWNGSAWVDMGSPGYSSVPEGPSLAVDAANNIYMAWKQLYTSDPVNFSTYQIYAARYNGAGWSGIGSSLTGAGISQASPMEAPIAPSVSLNQSGVPYVAWQVGFTNGNAVYLKSYSGGSWSEISGSATDPGISVDGGYLRSPVVAVDSYDAPFVCFDSIGSVEPGDHQVLCYGIEMDREAPVFEGLRTAVGTSNSTVQLSWLPAFDSGSTTIIYRIYRSTGSVPCGTTPSCVANDVFDSPFVTVLNQTSYEVSGLTDGQVYCFGVRAGDTNGQFDANTVMLSAGPWVGTGDPDLDCLGNLDEAAAGTDPCNADTDGDTMWDGWEWTFSTNNAAHTNALAMDPLDNGTDRVRTTEVNDGNPLQAGNNDLDGDGASNVEEFEWWFNHGATCAVQGVVHSPDPTNVDTDGDGLSDGWEMANAYNPVVSNSVLNDADLDGLDDLGEFAAGTDPGNPDTDGDGLYDGNWTSYTNAHPANPLGATANEFEGTWQTSPILADSDMDGLDDGDEVLLGYDPTVAGSVFGIIADGDLVQLGLTNPSDATNAISPLGIWDFETATNRAGWTHYAPSAFIPFDYWHVTITDPAPQTNVIKYLNQRSTNKAFRMAQDLTPNKSNVDATYNIGSVLECALQSPTINAESQSCVVVEWNEYYETEKYNDVLTVQARGGDDENWVSVSSIESGYSTYEDPVYGNSVTGWVHRTADLSRFAGETNVQVRFLFSAQNAIQNDFRGWWVDDVIIYGGRMISGWVRNENGAPIEGAQVFAVGQGGVTNVQEGFRVVAPGKIFGDDSTAKDGSYSIACLYGGHYHVKATAPSYEAEFYNGELFTNGYQFGHGANPGVTHINNVGPSGHIDVRTDHAVTNIYFELAKGRGRSYLAVAAQISNPVPVLANGQQAEIWNGSTNAPAWVAYTTKPAFAAISLDKPDWVTNAVQPGVIGELSAGRHFFNLGTNGPDFLKEVELREGEVYAFEVRTNLSYGYLQVKADDSGSYDIWLNGRDTGESTPHLFPVPVGTAYVTLIPTNDYHIGVKTAVVRPAQSTTVIFDDEDINGNAGSIQVRVRDLFGASISGVDIFLNGTVLRTNTPTDITTLQKFRPGMHYINVWKDGFMLSETRAMQTYPYATNIVTFVLGDADRDYDRVGDYTEVSSYTNVFLYSRDDDPDGDGLSNLEEFSVFESVGFRSNPFLFDTDNDGLSDGQELGYDGITNRMAMSTLVTNSIVNGRSIRTFFSGRFLDGVDFFGSQTVIAAVECDRFEAPFHLYKAPVVPSASAVETVFTNIPMSVTSRSLSVGHNKGADVIADTVLSEVDTDGDGMWDGFEVVYMMMESLSNPGTFNRILDPLECSDPDGDPDKDGLSNYREFLGPDGKASDEEKLTNGIDDDGDGVVDDSQDDPAGRPEIGAQASDGIDNDGDGVIDDTLAHVAGRPENFDWSDPRTNDSDSDGLPDGWEYTYGMNPLVADAMGDDDGDGLLNISEFSLGTNPRLKDTDADFLPDNLEVMKFKTNPLDPDTDKDGLLDGREVYDKDMDGVQDGGFFPFWVAGSDIDDDGLWDGPTDWDTDGDGMPDGFEVMDAFGNIYMDVFGKSLDPTDPTDADDDADNDGLTNLQEYLVENQFYGVHPSQFSSLYDSLVWDYSSNPFMIDSDGDGMPDGWETMHGLQPMDPIPAPDDVMYLRAFDLGNAGDPDGDGLWNDREFRIRFYLNESAESNEVTDASTHPWNPDTDEDGLYDGEEDRTYRANPIVQDTDGDRLLDGEGVDGRPSELETTNRPAFSIYSLLPCTNCTWEEARDYAKFAHPMYPEVEGHLATLPTSEEILDVYTGVVFNSGVQRIAIGGINVGATNEYDWEWITGEWFYQYMPFFNMLDGTTNWLNTAYSPNYLMADTNLYFYAVVQTQQFDAYLVEWDVSIPSSNAYDQALNDLWELRFYEGDKWLPYWAKVEPTNSIRPSTRWGHQLTYNAVYETKNNRDQDRFVLMDNRRLILTGGRDGNLRKRDIWEFSIKDNRWIRSNQDLSYFWDTGDNRAGLSEHSAVGIYKKRDTKPDACECNEDLPYNCESTDLYLPKIRPYQDHANDHYTLIIGGWNHQREYDFSGIFYKPNDDRTPLVETNLATTEVGLMLDLTGAEPELTADTWGENLFPLGIGTLFNEAGDPIELLGYAGTFFDKTYLKNSCENILGASLNLTVAQQPPVPIDVEVVLEFFYSEGQSIEDYNAEGPGGINYALPNQRVDSAFWFNSARTNFVIYPTSTVIQVDVSGMFESAVLAPEWNALSIGAVFIATNTSDYAQLSTEHSELVVAYDPKYRIDAEIGSSGTTLRRLNYGSGELTAVGVTGFRDFERKNMAIVAIPGPDGDGDQKLVRFGGINGNTIYQDTYEGTLGFNPQWITWELIEASRSLRLPPARYAHSMAYDAANERVLMFGGFDKNHNPLNDLWAYYPQLSNTEFTTNDVGQVVGTNTTVTGGYWEEVTAQDLGNLQRPRPRGGACMVYHGSIDFDRGIGDYCATEKGTMILFGGTDGQDYFNDLWVLHNGYWRQAQPNGEMANGPSPRAYAAMTYAQNASEVYDVDRGDAPDKCAKPRIYMFGGRSGCLPTSKDTDNDLVDDGVEHELGGPAAGRDPRVNKLIHTNSLTESVPYNLQRIGPYADTDYSLVISSNLIVIGDQRRGAIANFESLKHEDARYASIENLPFEWGPDDYDRTVYLLDINQAIGVEAYLPQQKHMWYHRFSGEDPHDERDVWELGLPDNELVGSNAAPPHAYSGTWCYGTDLNGLYPADAMMDLYSPVFSLRVPPGNSVSTNYSTTYHVMFREWLNLADSNDVVRVDLIRPTLPADVSNRKPGTKPVLPVVPARNNQYNTKGQWRRVVAPLEVGANDTNVFLRFRLHSDTNDLTAGGWYIDDVAILQGAEIEGTFTNLSNGEVILVGTNYIGSIYTNTLSGEEGLYGFGLLPLGDYVIGSRGTTFPVSLRDGNTQVNLGETNVNEVVVTISGPNPLVVSWPAVPGATYRIQSSGSIFGPWTTMDSVTAADLTEYYYDYSASGPFYRVILESGL